MSMKDMNGFMDYEKVPDEFVQHSAMNFLIGSIGG